MKLCNRTGARIAGFTLLELLVALVLLSLVFLFLTSGFQFAKKVWAVQDGERPDSSEVVAVQKLLRRLLSEARPVMIKRERKAYKQLLFEGNENSIHFIAPVPSHLGVGGFYQVTIYLAEVDQSGQSGNRLMLSWRLFRESGASSGSAVKEQHIALISGVTQLQFAYWGSHEKKPRIWYNSWHNALFFPDGVRMRVKFTGDHIWPDLVVAPMVQSVGLVIPEHDDF